MIQPQPLNMKAPLERGLRPCDRRAKAVQMIRDRAEAIVDHVGLEVFRSNGAEFLLIQIPTRGKESSS